MRSIQQLLTLMCMVQGVAWRQAHSPVIALASETPDKTGVLNGRQLFIDNFVIARTDGVRKVLNQPVKHPNNPIP